MLKKIATSEMRLGMYLHGLEGNWLEHPFWRNKFVIAEASDLALLQDSSVTHCWIDASKGIDVEAPAANAPVVAAAEPPPAAAAPRPPAEAAPRRPADDDLVPAPSARFEDELERAARLWASSREKVRQLFGEVRLRQAISAESVAPMVEELAGSVFRHPGALISLARLKIKDDYTYMHSVAVSALMIALARQLGLGVAACREAGLAGLLHDTGKALMPLEVLNKPGQLTDQELRLIRTHPVEGHHFLSGIGGFAETALDVCLHHHEKFDGSGYPHGLRDEAISVYARMGAICDVYDAVTSTRAYRSAWDPGEAIAQMASWKGHFDPKLFGAFVRSLGIYPTGSLVRLRSGRLAVVVHQHPDDLTEPTVKAFYSLKSNLPIPIVELDLSRRDVNDAIVAREPRSQWNFPHLDQLWAGDAANRR